MNIRGAGQLGAVDQITGHLQSFHITTRRLYGRGKHEATMRRFTLFLLPLRRVIRESGLHIGESFFQYSYTVTHEALGAAGAGAGVRPQLEVGGAAHPRLLGAGRGALLAGHAAHLVKHVRRHARPRGGLRAHEYLEVGGPLGALYCDGGEAGARAVLHTAAAAFCLIPDRCGTV